MKNYKEKKKRKFTDLMWFDRLFTSREHEKNTFIILQIKIT